MSKPRVGGYTHAKASIRRRIIYSIQLSARDAIRAEDLHLETAAFLRKLTGNDVVDEDARLCKKDGY